MSIISPDTNELVDEYTADVDPQAPKRHGRPKLPRDPITGEIIRADGSKGKPTTRARSKISLETQLDGFVTLVNTFVIAFRPVYALDQVEKVALVKALDQQCAASPKFRKYIEKFLQAGGGVNLLGVVAIIVGRRAVRAGAVPLPEGSPITPQDLDNMAGGLLFAMTTGTPNAVPTGN